MNTRFKWTKPARERISMFLFLCGLRVLLCGLIAQEDGSPPIEIHRQILPATLYRSHIKKQKGEGIIGNSWILVPEGMIRNHGLS